MKAGPPAGRRRTGTLVAAAIAVLAIVELGIFELRTSTFQALFLSRYSSRLSWEVGEGPSTRIAFPEGGPFDELRGYAGIPRFVRRLEARGFRVVRQAQMSPELERLVAWRLTPPFREPTAAGLRVRSHDGTAVYDALRSEVRFGSFDEVPPILVEALLAIENRELGEPLVESRNPAVEWDRLARAGLVYLGGKLGLPFRLEGGSTLATQLEKYRHSEQGRTGTVVEKIRQMTSASLKAYSGGADTREWRRAIILDYLNTMPLAAAPGVGEVYGFGAGLEAWFGMSLAEVTSVLRGGSDGPGKARALKHSLALLASLRAPSRYLAADRDGLAARLGLCARLLVASGVVRPELAAAMSAIPLEFSDRPLPVGQPPELAERKALNALRSTLGDDLGVASFYDLDRLHLEVASTLDLELERAAVRLFEDLGDREFVRANHLDQERLLRSGDPAEVSYSLELFERTREGNALRVHADNLKRPFDLNRGMKMELGSTAKLRTVAHYLEVVERLHRELSLSSPIERAARARQAPDPITRWAAGAFPARSPPKLEDFLAAALERRYSASPGETFFTGGGIHTFGNFDPHDDRRVFSVREALQRSINLVFVRLMRDLVRYHVARLPYDSREVLANPRSADRSRLVGEIAEAESRRILYRAWRRFRGRTEPEVIAGLLGSEAASARRLAVVFHAWRRGAGATDLARWLETHGRPTPFAEVERLARRTGRPHFGLLDHAYLLDRHPLDLWAAGELAKDPTLAWAGLLARSDGARREASRWLEAPASRRAQDLRLRIRFEEDAFRRMTADWRRLGFPFERLVPSYATALGNSADRPAALAELAGIILNDGMRRPAVEVTRLRFAAATPYETELELASQEGERVMSAPVARALRRLLAEVVEKGTARRLAGSFVTPEGLPVAAGGKTGSGDNRFETFDRQGGVTSSRAVNRTATFVFYVGDRYFGVLTASVDGPDAAGHEFTSALPVTVLKLLAPAINRRLAADAAELTVAQAN